MTQSSDTGIRTFQPRFMNWSYRSRGRVPRNQMNTNRNAQTFRTNHRTGHHPELAPAHRFNGNGARLFAVSIYVTLHQDMEGAYN